MPGRIVAVSMPRPDRMEAWIAEFRPLLPGFTVLPASEVRDAGAVEYAIVWKPPAGLLKGYPNLKATVSVGAGIDHVAADAEYPRGVPVIKTIGPDMTLRMQEYVCLHVLRLHRDQPRLEAAQRRGAWDQHSTPTARDRRVGILGMGHLGQAAALALAGFGFDVAGWSRSGRGPEGIAMFGAEGLEAFLARTDILVCLLPLTAETEGILDARTLGMLPKGACLVNAARGGHLVEEDLLAALASGQVSHATLDVFAVEPLPAGHPFWSHPQVTVTPHVASLIDPKSGGRVIAGNILDFEAGEEVRDLTWIGRGY
ncbi:2-hydroxyacid dehydrogenase [Oceaniglobus roseus]|uniref:2-hydroxyacid dehydrogenase n=1 Tax=Oceaniglobus roseus TaxID=1737570 RepID=UPI000C7E8F9E|nr:glyoxylate/hydroxypyruvate reductase A [Kandeliimicrobium roseum]